MPLELLNTTSRSMLLTPHLQKRYILAISITLNFCSPNTSQSAQRGLIQQDYQTATKNLSQGKARLDAIKRSILQENWNSHSFQGANLGNSHMDKAGVKRISISPQSLLYTTRSSPHSNPFNNHLNQLSRSQHTQEYLIFGDPSYGTTNTAVFCRIPTIPSDQDLTIGELNLTSYNGLIYDTKRTNLVGIATSSPFWHFLTTTRAMNTNRINNLTNEILLRRNRAVDSQKLHWKLLNDLAQNSQQLKNAAYPIYGTQSLNKEIR